MVRLFPWVMVAATVVLTVYGQLILKWQAGLSGVAVPRFLQNAPEIVQMLLRPWVISAYFAAFSASICWVLALRQLELSRAYPFTACSFLLVAFLAAYFFGEELSPLRILGIMVVVAGLVIIARS